MKGRERDPEDELRRSSTPARTTFGEEDAFDPGEFYEARVFLCFTAAAAASVARWPRGPRECSTCFACALNSRRNDGPQLPKRFSKPPSYSLELGHFVPMST